MRFVVFFALLLATSLASAAPPSLICCGMDEVFIIPATPGKLGESDKLWSWTAASSPEIPQSQHAQFRTTDECKPYDKWILITSSSGGVALVERDTKRAIYVASARNAHSACLLPEKRIAVASSFGGDELLIFSYSDPASTTPIARTKLVGAHGTWWDVDGGKLYALGSEELLLVSLKTSAATDKTALPTLEIVVEKTWQLPEGDGHDLSPTAGGKSLLITSASKIHTLDLKSQTFAPFELLPEAKKVKSIDQHRESKRFVLQQADLTSNNWWSNSLQLLDSLEKIELPDERLYKARWDQPLAVP